MASSVLLSPPSSFTSWSYPSSSASSMSSLNTPPQSATRRIRFAPLPDTRRFDHPEQLSIVDLDDMVQKQSNYTFDDSPSSSDSERPPSPQFCSSPPSPKPTKHQMLAHHPVAPSLHWSKPKSLSLLPFPFKRFSSSSSSSPSSPPTLSGSSQSMSSPSTDNNTTPTDSRIENLTLGTINMFRPTRKNPHSTPNSPSWGFGLTRWSSPRSTLKSGSPLSRSQSVPTSPSLLPPVPLKSNPTLPNQTSKPRVDSISASSSSSTKKQPRRGLLMLNGRVYGGHKQRHSVADANPFANARDDDLEFVEWGYGGMGSVRGARSAGIVGNANDRERTKWERLQHNGRNVVAGHVDEDDDGSGMEWVKKRKAARERKEKEEKERAESQAESVQSSLPEIPSSPTRPLASSTSIATPRAGSPIEADTPSPEHITAVTLPAHLPRHRRVQPGVTTVIPNEAPTGSETETDSETELNDYRGRGAEDDDEEDQEETRRKTALGAGVEKISRHN